MVSILYHELRLPSFPFNLPSFAFTPTEQWEINRAELTLGRELGSGQFGLVLEAKWKKVKVAVKMIREECMSDDDFQEEARVMM